MLQDFGVSLQRGGDCFAEFEESDGSLKESFELVRLHQRFAAHR